MTIGLLFFDFCAELWPNFNGECTTGLTIIRPIVAHIPSNTIDAKKMNTKTVFFFYSRVFISPVIIISQKYHHF